MQNKYTLHRNTYLYLIIYNGLYLCLLCWMLIFFAGYRLACSGGQALFFNLCFRMSISRPTPEKAVKNNGV